MKLGFFLKEGLRLWYMILAVTLAAYEESLFRFVPYRPLAANIMVTHICNSRCRTCSMWQKRSSGELSTAEMCDIITQLREIGVRRICFSGGEPTLRDDLPQLIRWARDTGFRHILVTSNGLSWNTFKARELLDSGLNRVTISIDGIGDAHDRQRGIVGAYERSLATVRMLVDLRQKAYHDLDIEIETTITKLNVANFSEVIQLCRELNVGWILSVFETDSFQFQGVDDSALRIDDQGEIDEAISKLHRMKGYYPLSPVISHVALDGVGHYLKRDTSRTPCPCAAAFTAIYVDACGKVYPGCWAQPPVGDLRKNDLTEIVGTPMFRLTLRRMFVRDCPTCPNSIIWSAWYFLPALVEEIAYRFRFAVRGRSMRRACDNGPT